MVENKNYAYGIRLAIIYSFVWFIDLLDASTLNVSLPAIAQSFQLDPTNTEWAIVGFLLSMTIGISISGWLGDRYGMRRIFLLSQLWYIGSSIGCGFSFNLSSLVFFRLIQGFAGGMAIPLGMTALMRAMPSNYWAKTSAYMNMVTLFAPALGPLFGAYVTSLLGWQWIFFLKLPLSCICFLLSLYWVKKEPPHIVSKFDWFGFILGGLSLSGILWVFSEVGKNTSSYVLIMISALSLLLGWIFIWQEKRSRFPLIPLSIFRIDHFTFGNLIQSAANTIFLGANFIIALYLQQGLGLNLVSTGWIMAAITPGMIIVQPLVGKLYNKLGPLPFMIPGLILLSLSTFTFVLTTPQTSPYLLSILVFCIGAASSMTQTANVTSIFSGLSHEYKGTGSVLYSLFKQISASFGVALSTMVLSIGMDLNTTAVNVSLPSSITFHYCFIALGAIPAIALIFCFFIDNQKALKQITKPAHIPTEAEFETE
jgi:EmrB/QacA subfamily drug resistance transporter